MYRRISSSLLFACALLSADQPPTPARTVVYGERDPQRDQHQHQAQCDPRDGGKRRIADGAPFVHQRACAKLASIRETQCEVREGDRADGRQHQRSRERREGVRHPARFQVERNEQVLRVPDRRDHAPRCHSER